MKKLLFIVLLFSFSLAQNPTADRLLASFIEAERTLKVDGDFSENLYFLNRKPKDKKHFIYPAILSEKLIKENYNLKILKEEQFLGRNVLVLELKPKYRGPYWQFIIDKRSASRLAYKQISPSGEVLAEGAYSKVLNISKRINPRPKKDLELSGAKRDFYNQAFINAKLPRGYIPVRITGSSLGKDKIPALRISFFDGLNTLILLVVLDGSKLTKDSEAMQSLELRQHFLIAIGPIGKENLVNWLESYKNTPLNHLDRQEIKSFLRTQ